MEPAHEGTQAAVPLPAKPGGLNSTTRWKIALLVILMLAGSARGQAGQAASTTQASEEKTASAALSAALVAACRQNEAVFGHYLTTENEGAFHALPAKERSAILRRFSLTDDPGRALLSSDPSNHTILRCEGKGPTVEFRFGDERLHENISFVPVQVVDGRSIEFGLVKEGGGWRLLSVGLLLLNIPELSKQWNLQALEARENEAVASLRSLALAIAAYNRAYNQLPNSLKQLGPAGKDGVSPQAAQLVDDDLANGERDGYRFRYRVVPATDGGPDGFEIAAQPVEYSKTGSRSFFLDAQGKVHAADHQGAFGTVDDPVLAAEGGG
ncbi:MAG: hypothetical protein ACRD4K_14605 [Candidatus Acidiferrales bacterium]